MMNNIKIKSLLLCSTILFFSKVASACDPCALYNASRMFGHSPESFTLGVSNQYTSFDKATKPDSGSIRDGELVKGFNTTQLNFGYDLNEKSGLQLTLPLVTRRFNTISRYQSESDSDFNLGDSIIAGNYSFYNYRDGEVVVLAGVTAGIKLPTGDTGVLEDVSTSGANGGLKTKNLFKHHQLSSSSGGGRALTFGSGSVDYIVGANLLTRYKRYFFLTNYQYTLRTEGDFDYEFADDMVWSTGPGYYFAVDDKYTVGTRVVASGEYKASDKLKGNKVEYSALSNLYVGPEIIATINNRYFIETGIDFRTSSEDASLTVVPTTRFRFSLSYRF